MTTGPSDDADATGSGGGIGLAEAVVAAGWTEPAVAGAAAWRRLAGGYHNDVYLVTGVDGPIVIKHFVANSTNPLFPQLPHDEFAALRFLGGRSIAPDPVGFLADVAGRAVLAYRYINGEMWTTGASDVGRLLRRVHDLPPPNDMRPLPSSGATVLGQALRIADATDPPAHGVAAAEWKRLQRVLEADVGTPTEPVRTFVHTDCGPGNIVVGADGLRLIDWQCPGVGDPVEDLANFASPAIHLLYGRPPLDAPGLAALLDGYGDAPAADRFATDRWPFHIRLAAYCAYRIVDLADAQPGVAGRYASALDAELELLESR